MILSIAKEFYHEKFVIMPVPRTVPSPREALENARTENQKVLRPEEYRGCCSEKGK